MVGNNDPTTEKQLDVESLFSKKGWQTLTQKVAKIKKDGSDKDLAKAVLQVVHSTIAASKIHLKPIWSKPILSILDPDMHVVGLGKSLEAAEQLKEMGNVEYRNTNEDYALNLWASGLRLTPVEDCGLSSFIYANRSLIMVEKGEHELALLDIHRALKNGYPKENWPKLLRRKALCLRALNISTTLENPESVLYEALEWSRIYKNESMEKCILRDLQKLKFNDDDDDDRLHLPKSSNQSTYFASSLQLTNKKYGRAFIATRDIAAGELLLQEYPMAWTVKSQFRAEHCAHCMVQLAAFTGIYCQICSIDEPYCSEKCRSKMSKIHAKECKKRWSLEVDDEVRLALRILFMKNYAPSYTSPIKSNVPNTPGCDENNCYFADMTCLESLVTHLEKHSTADLTRYGATAALIGEYLGFPMEEQIRFLCLLAKIRCNAAAIVSIQSQKSSEVEDLKCIVGEVTERIGVGMYPIFSLLNHSCDPNSFVSFPQGDTVLHIRNLRNIKKGEEITISYGPLYRRKPTEIRQKLCKSAYFFNCECPACQGLLEDVDRYTNAFPCPKCPFPLRAGEPRCPKCKTKIDLAAQKKRLEIARSFEHIARTASEKDFPDRLEQSIRFYEAVYHPKSIELGKVYDSAAEELCKEATSEDTALFDRAAKWCEKSVQIVKHIFGADSIEAAQEHFKLCTILMAGSNIDAAVKAIVSGIQLYSKLYGLSSVEKSNLEEMLHFINLRRSQNKK